MDPVERLNELREASGSPGLVARTVVGPAGHDPTKTRFEQALEWFRQRKEAHEKQRNESPPEDNPWRQLMRRCGRV